MSASRRAATAAALALTVLCAVVAWAEVRYLKREPGTWKPWHMTLSSGARQAVKASAAELKAFEAELLKFRDILKAAPSAAQPVGFSVETWGHLSGGTATGQAAGRGWPIPGGVDFGAFPIFEYERGGKMVREDTGETALLQFAVNDISPSVIGLPGPPEWNALDLDVYTAPPATGLRAGWPRYQDIVLITKRTAPPWTPVTVGEALAIDRKASEARLIEAREVVGKVQKDLDELIDPVRKVARQAEYERNATSMPDAKAYLKQMAEVDRLRESSLRAELDPARGSMKRVLETEREVSAVDRRLAEMPEADKEAPACYAPAATAVEMRIRRGAAPGCGALVRPNRDFFERQLPRSAPQVVVVLQARRCYENAQPTDLPSGCPANRALLESLDRQAILDWLK